jgi:predicted CXXCH cytochrome family protein
MPSRKALLVAKWVHDPFKTGDCQRLSRPARFGESALLSDAIPALCTNCHDDSDGKMKRRTRRRRKAVRARDATTRGLPGWPWPK